MPRYISKIRWKCEQCKKTFWMKPWEARTKRFCSRLCLHRSMHVENPVRPGQRNMATYGERQCLICLQSYVARNVIQKYCSQICALKAVWERNKNKAVGDRQCEVCGKIFRPKNTRNAGRYCSRPCNYKGQQGQGNGNWRGGRHIDKEGYARVIMPEHPAAVGHGGYVKEHRIVMEKMLGRLLRPGENVHHKNGKKDDNREENLELWSRPQLSGQRVEDQVRWAREIIRDYGHLFPEESEE